MMSVLLRSVLVVLATANCATVIGVNGQEDVIYPYFDDMFMFSTRENLDGNHGTMFDHECQLYDYYDEEPPRSIQEMQPHQVEVIASIGDSFTTGLGMNSGTFRRGDFLREFRGRSFSIGGDEDLSKVTTLPNILKVFNPKLRGYSTGISEIYADPGPSEYNVAHSGATYMDIFRQAKQLVNRLEENGDLDSWKIINIHLGLDGLRIKELCNFRELEKYFTLMMRSIHEGFMYLIENTQNGLINFISSFDITDFQQADDGGLFPLLVRRVCKIIHKQVASCAIYDENHYAQMLINELNNYFKYNYADMTYPNNNAAVFQPFFTRTYLPRNNLPDQYLKYSIINMSYIAADCFHFTENAHRIFAIYLWNNLFISSDGKDEYIDWENPQLLYCPYDYRVHNRGRMGRHNVEEVCTDGLCEEIISDAPKKGKGAYFMTNREKSRSGAKEEEFNEEEFEKKMEEILENARRRFDATKKGNEEENEV